MFQHSVLEKYRKQLDESQINQAFGKFQDYFGNPQRQSNIREAKEEQFQEGFLRELFVNILGYTLNPEPAYNLTTEFKNEKGSKKADGAVLIEGKALAVIELKGTDTKDLDKINDQAFGYKNNHDGCTYVVTSNFEKLRFFINNAVEHIEFNLFNLNQNEFEILWICLAQQNLLGNIPLKIKEESITVEENVTKQLYKDYSQFKRDLWQNMVKNRPEEDQLILYKKSQKLLDRFLFIFFAEDSGLLPPNSITRMEQRWRTLKEEDAYKPLYEIFKQYFGYINTGRKGKTSQDDIYAYNGGLFQEDEILDSVSINDEVLQPHVMKLTAYDFSSEIDVNILGHIFENSLNEIENVKAQLEGVEIDKSKTKRKKDGVFYTPKYITKYIVDNTVGKLCDEKKMEFGIIDEEYAKGRKYRKKDIIKSLDGNLQKYRDWLLQITICDPACGSGAFLNQALEFLIDEHRYIDELQVQLLEQSIMFQDVRPHILENNLYGVDINEESVEIAKLSLWLRTAHKDRKLTSLSNNIKCGNSLIDDPSVAGDKAFKWEEEFPSIFKNGGFDVVIGNPPYVTRGLNDLLKSELKKRFKTAQYQLEFYVAFIEKGICLIKPNGIISYIVPNSWLKNMMMSECRLFILENLSLVEIIPNLENVFEDASVDTMIFVGRKSTESEKLSIAEFRNSQVFIKHEVNQDRFLKNEGYILDVEISPKILPIIQKVKKDAVFVGDIFDIIRGINPYDKYTGQSQDIIKSRAYHSPFKKDETFVPELKGMHVSRYLYSWDKKHFISYGDWLAAPREEKYFEGKRIVFREILGKTLVSTLIEEDFKIDRSLYIAKLLETQVNNFHNEYVLGILNSKLLAFYFRYSNNEFDNLFPKIRVAEFKKLPIKNIEIDDQKDLSVLVKRLLIFSNKLESIRLDFIELLSNKYNVQNFTKKLSSWFLIDPHEFLKELKKVKKLIDLSEESTWLKYFNEQKLNALELKSQIDQTDKEIDQMVYQLYGLTEEEIKIVEGS